METFIYYGFFIYIFYNLLLIITSKKLQKEHKKVDDLTIEIKDTIEEQLEYQKKVFEDIKSNTPIYKIILNIFRFIWLISGVFNTTLFVPLIIIDFAGAAIKNHSKNNIRKIILITSLIDIFIAEYVFYLMYL